MKREPLPAGSIIDFCGEVAVVVSDDGGDRITVEIDGSKQRWWWTFEGEDCTVVSTP